MATHYKETEVPEGDVRSDMFDHLAQERPWALTKTLNALPS